MKAAIYPGGGQPLVIETLPDPTPGPEDVIVRVARCGICGTDLSMTKGEMWDYGAGNQLGHEFAGEIVAVGKAVQGLMIGDPIAVVPSGACGHCAGCDGGNHVMCRNSPPPTGGFAELARLPASLAVPLPKTLSMADGALVEPLAVSLYGVRQSGLRKGAPVLVLGGGTVALYTIYWARRLGAGPIVALSRSLRRKELCLQMGADAFVEASDDDVSEVIEHLGGKPEIVFECAGAEGMLNAAARHAATYGTVVSLGFCTAPDTIMPAMAAYQCLTYKFLVGYRMAEFTYIADQMDKGHIDPKLIVTSEIGLAALPQTFAALRAPNQETKVHVVM